MSLLDRRYQKSLCKRKGYLHKFRIITQTDTGLLERCARCGKNIHFPINISNKRYLDYHIRDILRKGDPFFHKEYPHVT